MKMTGTTPLLEEFTGTEMRRDSKMTPTLRALLLDIAAAGKLICEKLTKLELTDLTGGTGVLNTHDEEIQKLDAYANLQLIQLLQQGGNCAGIASEEMDEFVAFKDPISEASNYVVVFDPLDGSNGITSNNAVGTIFGIYQRLSSTETPCEIKDFLQPGNKMIGAGYFIYSAATIFVFTTGSGVHGFTLDQGSGFFRLSHRMIQCPYDGMVMSVNEAYSYTFPHPIQAFIKNYQAASTFRYAGSLVADIHRILMNGGLFLYPATATKPEGKLRLVYECNPLGFIFKEAGGSALSNGEDILNLHPAKLHQTAPFIIGSLRCIEQVNEFLALPSASKPFFEL